VARGLAALGWVDRASRRPLDSTDVRVLVRPTRMVFDRLGLVPHRWGAQVPPSAAVLARAVLHGDERREPVPPPAETPLRELTVTLLDVEPPVERRIVVPESLSLRELHAVLQTAIGWQDAHLHLFRVGEVQYGDVDDFPGELGDEGTTAVGEVAEQCSDFGYEYDFGDGWKHRIDVGARTTGPDVPRCLAGARACPPEDCGGVPGYERLLTVLADPGDPEHAELTEWLGAPFDPAAFDVAAVDYLLALNDRHLRQRRRP